MQKCYWLTVTLQQTLKCTTCSHPENVLWFTDNNWKLLGIKMNEQFSWELHFLRCISWLYKARTVQCDQSLEGWYLLLTCIAKWFSGSYYVHTCVWRDLKLKTLENEHIAKSLKIDMYEFGHLINHYYRKTSKATLWICDTLDIKKFFYLQK